MRNTKRKNLLRICTLLKSLRVYEGIFFTCLKVDVRKSAGPIGMSLDGLGKYMENSVKLQAEHAVWLIGSICRFHRIPFDSALLVQQHPPEAGDYGIAELLRALNGLGLRHGQCAAAVVEDFSALTLPCIAFLRTEPSDIPDESASDQDTPEEA